MLPKHQHFYFKHGPVASSLKELLDHLKQIDDDVFSHHVTKQNNDFSNWIKHVLNDDLLAKDIASAPKHQAIALIAARLRYTMFSRK